ncbi:MAG: NUDIX hydrolase [Patescibacteria group bacterium]|nr:NUDIX hydrolase [Patescibacteria group bacterium]
MIYHEKPDNFQAKFSTVSCYLEHDTNILFLLRQDYKSEGNRWGMPAGKIDEGEDKLEAMLREIKEETGQELFPADVEYLQTVYVRYPEYDFIYHMFRSRFSLLPIIKLSATEHKDYCWCTPQEALKLDLVKDLDACLKLSYMID